MKAAFYLAFLLGAFLAGLAESEGPDITLNYGNKRTSLVLLAKQLNVSIGGKFLNGCDSEFKASCKGKCGRKVERTKQLLCYCDALCHDLGDCCYDYYSWCKHVKTSHLPLSSCVKPRPFIYDDSKWGYIMVDDCPLQLERNSSTVRACTEDSQSDLFTTLPVFDHVTKLTYKNYFCAKCNRAAKVSFWKLEAKCSRFMTSRVNASDLISNIRLCESFKFLPPNNQVRLCIHRVPSCFRAPFHTSVKWEVVYYLCKAYYFPVCKDNREYNNPHCSLCNVFPWFENLNSFCTPMCTPPELVPPIPDFIPPLTIVFEFSSTSHYNIDIDGERKVVKTGQCQEDKVYDPFSKICRDAGVDILRTMTATNTTQSNESVLLEHCVLVSFNMTEVEIFSNGSLYVIPHGAVYNRTVYIKHGDEILVCTNYSSNYTEYDEQNEKYNMNGRTDSLALQIITFIVGVLSVICLILLLVVYVKIKEYKKMSGKIVMSLSCTLLVYQVFFFLTGLTGNPDLCSTVAAVVHYFLLAAFTWMNILALDMTITFSSPDAGIKSIKSNSGNGQRKKFIRYSCHGWITPLVWVGVCLALDLTRTVSVGYGSRKMCWIANPFYFLGLPVAVILAFNLVALALSVVAIRQVRESTRRVTKDKRQLHLTLLTLKLTVIFGLTWALGFGLESHVTKYLFVILNSAQGLLLFLALKVYKKLYIVVKEAARTGTSSQVSRKPTDSSHTAIKRRDEFSPIALDDIRLDEPA